MRFGGPIRTLAALIDQQPDGFESLTVTSDRDHGDRSRLPVTSNEVLGTGGRYTYYVSGNSPRAIVHAFREVRRFRPQAIYVNSFFDSLFSIAPQVAHALGLFGTARLVIAPRGEMGLGALAIHSRKKRLFLRLYTRTRMHRRILWHASTTQERADIVRVFDSSAPIVVRENETRLPDRARPAEPTPDRILSLVFLSRVSEKKGLHTLLEALRHASEPIALSVFGYPENPHYTARCEALAQRLPAHVLCSFKGPVDPDGARETFAAFDLFAFPTAGENFGHVIAESLSVSCPVMCADTTPWTRLMRTGGAGIVVESLDAADWTAAIDAYARMSPDERLERRRRAGVAYDLWRHESKGEHVFEKVRRLMS